MFRPGEDGVNRAPVPRPLPILRLPAIPRWRKKSPSPVSGSSSPGEGALSIGPPSSTSWDGLSEKQALTPPLTSPPLSSSPISLPDQMIRETLFIKNLPPTPDASPPAPRRPPLVRKPTPHPKSRAAPCRPQSSDAMPPMHTAHRVEAGRVSPVPAIQEHFRRRSSLPTLEDLRTAANRDAPANMGHLMPPVNRWPQSSRTPSLPRTPSECGATFDNAYLEPMIARQASLSSLDDLPVVSGLGLVGATDAVDNQLASSTTSSIIEGYAEYNTSIDSTTRADERFRALEALEGRSPPMPLTDEEEEDLRMQVSPSYFFQRSRFSSTHSQRKMEVVDAGVQTETTTMAHKSIQVIAVQTTERAAIHEMREEVERLRSQVALLKEQLGG